MGDLDKLVVAKGFKNLPKVQYIAQSGHTGHNSKKRDTFTNYFSRLGKVGPTQNRTQDFIKKKFSLSKATTRVKIK